MHFDTPSFLQTNRGKIFQNSIFLYIYISAHLYIYTSVYLHIYISKIKKTGASLQRGKLNRCIENSGVQLYQSAKETLI